MKSLVGTVNAGYLITDDHSGHFLGTRVCIGHNPHAVEPWVCWDWNQRGGFNNGRYCVTEEAAYDAMMDRLDYDDIFEV